MQLSKNILSQIDTSGTDAPQESYFHLPEKVIQFGTGVLLRALPDHYIDQANKQQVYNGRIVMVKSTGAPGMESFEKQNGLYTVCLRGLKDGQPVEKISINASVSRLLYANHEWDKVLQCAQNPTLELVLSNSTEVGLVLADDDVRSAPPVSFPGKLLAFLYERFRFFQGDLSRGMVIVPTELVTDNADKLLRILIELTKRNNLSTEFMSWLQNGNCFCNSLVDRIVPGRLSASLQQEMEARVGYEDQLMIMSEFYGLWAIQSDNPKVKQALAFSQVDTGVQVMADITVPRELKLRILNGSLSFCCGLGFLSGFQSVKESMDNAHFAAYIEALMIDEIVPTVVGENISVQEATAFARTILQRFRNPFNDHRWLAISLQYTSKMATRNIPLIGRYLSGSATVPKRMALGFAGYLEFMKPPGARLPGSTAATPYAINDDSAEYFAGLWSTHSAGNMVKELLGNTDLWLQDLSGFTEFGDAVAGYLESFSAIGINNTLAAS